MKATRLLEKKADRLLQIKYVNKYPSCLVCGQQTSEMHHFIPKSQSNALRYSENNLVPLCKRCHCRHHLSGDPSIVATIVRKKGMEWYDFLQHQRHEICKMNKEYLLNIIKSLS